MSLLNKALDAIKRLIPTSRRAEIVREWRVERAGILQLIDTIYHTYSDGKPLDEAYPKELQIQKVLEGFEEVLLDTDWDPVEQKAWWDSVNEGWDVREALTAIATYRAGTRYMYHILSRLGQLWRITDDKPIPDHGNIFDCIISAYGTPNSPITREETSWKKV